VTKRRYFYDLGFLRRLHHRGLPLKRLGPRGHLLATRVHPECLERFGAAIARVPVAITLDNVPARIFERGDQLVFGTAVSDGACPWENVNRVVFPVVRSRIRWHETTLCRLCRLRSGLSTQSGRNAGQRSLPGG
jgi:hypothetical protein